MLQFRNGPRPRNYLAKREQLRLLALVMFLMGVVWIAIEARNPQYYRWLWNWGPAVEAGNEPVNTRLQIGDSSGDDTFLLPHSGEHRDESRQDTTGPPSEADLATVRDNEPFRAGEQGAWFKLLNQLRSTKPAVLRERSIGLVSFIQLYRQPEEYRGELVTLAGTLRRAERVTSPPNDLGIESYYQTWLFPRDNPTNPIVVYVLTLPDGFPEGMTIEEQVELDGFFFKRWPYAAQDAVRLAPVVLAKSFRWFAVEPEEATWPVSPLTILCLAVSVAASCVVLVWWRTRPTRATGPLPDVVEGLTMNDSARKQGSHLHLLTDPEKESEP